ncbi:hypothetical protein IU486_05630 [Streptomyces gardneri]|uniref:DUF6191 domain-containing protein n=1 Tax=Nocardia TaxID=1817 RepID=UPI001358BCDF|nr:MULTISPECIES: DUF6191 domain-containing protein [Nocardia]MBF6164257.1 hypothetical protein [Streptomyces gardneri]MBF6205064.1 hypothetical protein [Streptomyces gardneri]UAK34190.1 DUF6191 domain-containing protein [Nocardia asteroides]
MALLQWSIPGWVILLVLVAVYELTVNKRRRRRRAPVSGTFTDEFTALFYATKRMELDHRESVSMLRDEQEGDAPPLVAIDLDRRKVVLRRNVSG